MLSSWTERISGEKQNVLQENGTVVFSTEAESGFSSNRKMAASVLYSSRHVSQ
ncbi:hypothetical protein LEMLEM_LOCUS10330 [Lemmus lemmus]